MRAFAALALLLVTSTGLLPVIDAATAETWTDGIYDVEQGMPQGAFAADAAVHTAPLVRIPCVTTVVAIPTIDDDAPCVLASRAQLPARAPPAR